MVGMLAIQRAGEALESETSMRVWERIKDGADLSTIAEDEIADWAIERYRPNIINGMRRAGLEVPADIDTMDGAALVKAIGDALELQLESLTPDAIADAVDKRMARDLGRKLGIEIPTLRDADAVRQACIDAVIEAVRSGKANQFISQWQIRRMKSVKAWADAGLAKEDRAKIQNRMSQRRWRKGYMWTWD